MDSKKFSNLTSEDFHRGDRVKHYSYATGTVLNKITDYYGGKILIRWDKLYRGKKESWAYPTSLKKLPKSVDIPKTLKDDDLEALVNQYIEEWDKSFDTNPLDEIIDKIYVDKKTGTVAVLFTDGVKEVVHKQPHDTFDINIGVALAIAKYFAGSNNSFHKTIVKKTIVSTTRRGL